MRERERERESICHGVWAVRNMAEREREREGEEEIWFSQNLKPKPY